MLVGIDTQAVAGVGVDRLRVGAEPGLWSHLRGWHRDLKLAGSGHLSYTDVAVLAEPLQLRGLFLPDLLGTIDGVRAADIEQTYLTAYFERFLLHRPEPLLDRPDPRWPCAGT